MLLANTATKGSGHGIGARELVHSHLIDRQHRHHLARLRMVLGNLPDEEILAELERTRGHGRGDYAVRAMWRAYLARFVF